MLVIASKSNWSGSSSFGRRDDTVPTELSEKYRRSGLPDQPSKAVIPVEGSFCREPKEKVGWGMPQRLRPMLTVVKSGFSVKRNVAAPRSLIGKRVVCPKSPHDGQNGSSGDESGNRRTVYFIPRLPTPPNERSPAEMRDLSCKGP